MQVDLYVSVVTSFSQGCFLLTFTSSWQVVDDAWLTDSMMVLFNVSMSLGGSGKHASCKKFGELLLVGWCI